MMSAELLARAGAQYGALGRAQLSNDFNVSDSAIRRACAHGRLIRAAHGVYRLRSAADTFQFRCSAATLFGRTDGFVSGQSAAEWRGLRRMRSRFIHYTVPAGFRRTPPDWMSLHFSKWYDADTDREKTSGGVMFATPLRMLFGLAAGLNQARFDGAADDAWNLGLIEPMQVWRYLEGNRCRGKDGVLRIAAWLERAMEQSAPSQSYLERDLISAIERIGIPSPVRQHPIVLATAEVIHVDAAWPDIQFAVEPGHSWFHTLGGGQERDHQRDLGCAQVGWQILRLNERMLTDTEAAARAVKVVYSSRRRTFRPTHSDPEFSP